MTPRPPQLRDQPPLERDPTWSDRTWNLLGGLDVLQFGLVLVCAVGTGIFVAGGWVLEAWQAGAWWRFGLLVGLSLFLAVGVVREVVQLRLGAFSLVVVGITVVLGARHVLGA